MEAQNGEFSKTEGFGDFSKRTGSAKLSPRRLVVLLDSRAAAGANLDIASLLILETVLVHSQKIASHLLHIATPLHGPQNHWGSLAPTKERPLSENQMCCVL